MNQNGNAGKNSSRLIALLMAAIMLVLMASPSAFAEEVATATVNFTLSSDGVPIVGDDGTVLSKISVTVPYFDLALYDLEQYYRFETEGNINFGPYINNKLVERPTILHLYIYMLERYYEGLPEEDCGKGLLDKSLAKITYDIYGKPVDSDPDPAFVCSGAATSFFMNSFWGHDCNLMYFVDHQYPLMEGGWGSTADYILLEDGMDVDVGMFTSWGFYHDGGFCYFDQDEYTFQMDEEVVVSVWKTSTGASVEGEYAIGVPKADMQVSLWSQDMTECIIEWMGDTDADGQLAYTFSEDNGYESVEPGVYTMIAMDPNYSTEAAGNVPAIATITLVGEAVALEGLNIGQEEIILNIGNTIEIKPEIQPADATNVKLTWESSAPEIVTVSDVGILSTQGVFGEAVITCTATDGTNTFTDECKVIVPETVAVTGVHFAEESVNVYVSEDIQLNCVFEPADAANKTGIWTSSNPEVAMVNHLGLVSAKKEGQVTITIKTNDGGFTAQCTVNVLPRVTGDMNGDGKINIVDVTKLVAGFRGKTDSAYFMDVNGDGKINIVDVTKLVAAFRGKTTLS